MSSKLALSLLKIVAPSILTNALEHVGVLPGEEFKLDKKLILYTYLMAMIGQPYRWGGDDTIDGFDCSGLALEALWSQGMGPVSDATAAEILKYYERNKVEKALFGALVFFGKDTPTHIGICLNDTLMIEAGGGGSLTTTKEAAAKQNAFVRIRPIKRRSDFLCFVLPPWPFL